MTSHQENIPAFTQFYLFALASQTQWPDQAHLAVPDGAAETDVAP
jgi:hypothetical protein